MSIFNRIYSRQQWGARHAAGWGDRSANYPLAECWTHHSVTAHLPENATVAQEMAQVRILEDIGQQRFGRGISYNFVIFPSGRIYMGLGASRVGAHTGGRNSTSLGVVFAGNYENHKPTAAAEATYAELLRDFHGAGILRNPRTNGGHKDAPGHAWNACAGRNLNSRLGAINSAASRPAQTPAPAAPKPAAPKPAAPAASTKPWPAGRGPWPDAYLTRSGRRNQYQDRALSNILGRVGHTGTFAQRLQKWCRADGTYTGQITPQSNDGPQTTRAWQTSLSKRTNPKTGRRFYTGRIDGIWGPQTANGTVDWLNFQADVIHGKA